MDGHRFLFLGGLHRSGTSIVHRLLREHPDTSGIEGSAAPQDEGQHLQSVFPVAQAFGGPGRFAFTDAAHLTETDPLVSLANREQLLREWGPWFDLDRTVLLEKSPPNLLRTRFLQALFPGARFVILVRHPVAVSLATVKWSKTSVSELLDHWRVAQQRFLDDQAKLENCLVLRYEDFVANPSPCLDAICRLCDIDAFVPQEPVRDHNARYFDVWNADRERFLRELQTANPDVHRLAERFGYSFEAPFVVDLPHDAQWR